MIAGKPILAVAALSVRFGGIAALSGITFDVEPGEAVGVVGPNGSGKTTLFNCIAGAVRRHSGTIGFAGNSIHHLPPFRRARLGVRRTFQNLALFDGMSVADNIRVAADHRAADKSAAGKAVAALIETFGLAAFADAPAATLSMGYRKRLEIARAMAGNPRLLLLDEPTAGILPRDAAAIVQSIDAARRERSMAILIVAHEMEVVAALADRVIVLDFGRIIAAGSPDLLRTDEAVRAAYFGTSA